MIPLPTIHRAIRANFIIDDSAKGSKLLSVSRKHDREVVCRYTGCARMIFLHIAKEAGYKSSDICTYLTMGTKEYNTKTEKMQSLMIDYPLDELTLHVSRKLKLIRSYLWWHHNGKLPYISNISSHPPLSA